MPRRVVKDTFVYEAVGPDLEVRRQAFAGQFVPDNYRFEDSSEVEDIEYPELHYPHEYTEGHGGVPHDYAHGVTEEIKETEKKSRRRRSTTTETTSETTTEG